jgi:prepilin-type N-terminal cleavage/methylation domain-containing protein
MPEREQHHSSGFTLIEVLIVIVILGVLASLVVFSVRGITDRGQASACETDERVLATAIEAYMTQDATAMIPATSPADAERYERTLLSSGLVRGLSEYWNVAAEGYLINVSPC